MKIYLVGGAVRDRLLGLPVKEKDWLVVGATVEQMKALGYRQLKSEFPVFIHPKTGEEYALARREIKTGPGYHGFRFEYGPHIQLEDDLIRRDLTINALAEDENGQIIDLFNGQDDLEQGILRHISPAFVQDPVRLLRIARFNARFAHWGFKIAHGTFGLLKKMAHSEELTHLDRSRFSREMIKSLHTQSPWRFFETLHRCGALEQILPSLLPWLPDAQSHQNEHYPLKTMLKNSPIEYRLLVCLALLPDQKKDPFQWPAKLYKISRIWRQLCLQIDAEPGPDLIKSLRAHPTIWPILASIICPEKEQKIKNALKCLNINAFHLNSTKLTGPELGQSIRQLQIDCLKQS